MRVYGPNNCVAQSRYDVVSPHRTRRRDITPLPTMLLHTYQASRDIRGTRIDAEFALMYGSMVTSDEEWAKTLSPARNGIHTTGGRGQVLSLARVIVGNHHLYMLPEKPLPPFRGRGNSGERSQRNGCVRVLPQLQGLASGPGSRQIKSSEAKMRRWAIS